jgi:hypothetical protein
MLLYHFSKMYFLQRGGTILREGLKPPDNNNVQLDALVDGVVWFTADPNPLGMFAKPWDRSDCRITCVIPVRDKRSCIGPSGCAKTCHPISTSKRLP